MLNNPWLKKAGKIATTLVVIAAASLALQSCGKIMAPAKPATPETMSQQTDCNALSGDAADACHAKRLGKKAFKWATTKLGDAANKTKEYGKKAEERIKKAIRDADNSTEPTNNGSAEAIQNKNNAATAATFDESKYPDFYVVTGKAQVNRQLNDSEIIYNKFDQYGRTQGVYAKLNHKNFTYGMRPRENISDIKPSGWVKNQRVELQFADGTKYHGYFYNRSHLLAHFLGGDDADYNMITGTRAQNVGKNNRHGGMQYTENLAHDYLRKHPDGTVYYAVVPNYVGSQLVPVTVTVDIQSNDKSIDQHVIVFNNAPGYNIDYATGKYYRK